MRLSFSNIAWDTEDDEPVGAALVSAGFTGIDVAPGKYFARLEGTSLERRAIEVRRWWNERSTEIVGLQSLLFGTSDLNVFGTPDSQARLRAELVRVARIATLLGASRMTFGSPTCRDRGDLDDDAADSAAVTFFRTVGEAISSTGAILCLEPNPERYSCNFMTNSRDTARVVRRIDHPNIAMQLDTGACKINGESVAEVLEEFGDLVAHIHASEPDLVPLGSGGADHTAAATAIDRWAPDATVTVEMRGPVPLDLLTSCAEFASSTYGPTR